MSLEISEQQREVCRRAVEHFGRRRQILKVAQELRELADECYLAAMGESDLAAFVDERADVAIMLYQLDALLVPSLEARVRVRIGEKIQMLKGRLRDERDGK